MKKKYLIISILLIISLKSDSLCAESNSEISDGVLNFLKIERLYNMWQHGPAGSSKYYRGRLQRYLSGLIGKTITTGDDYLLESPGGIYSKEFFCNLKSSRWLYIHGNIDAKSAREFIKDKNELFKNWWRSGRLVILSGKLRRFRFGKDSYGDTVDLYLRRIRILENLKNRNTKKIKK